MLAPLDDHLLLQVFEGVILQTSRLYWSTFFISIF